MKIVIFSSLLFSFIISLTIISSFFNTFWALILDNYSFYSLTLQINLNLATCSLCLQLIGNWMGSSSWIMFDFRRDTPIWPLSTCASRAKHLSWGLTHSHTQPTALFLCSPLFNVCRSEGCSNRIRTNRQVRVRELLKRRRKRKALYQTISRLASQTNRAFVRSASFVRTVQSVQKANTWLGIEDSGLSTRHER